MKTATMQDVANKAHVSITTISRYINKTGYVSQDKQLEIEKAMKELGYTHSSSKRDERQKIIGHIIPRSETALFYDRLSASLVFAADSFGYQSLIAQSDSDEVTGPVLIQLLKKLCDNKVCGIVVGGICDDAMSDKTRQFVQELPIPVVFIERTFGCTGFNRVEIDIKAGMMEAVRHLISKGHRKILYLDGHKHTDTPGKRMQGFQEAVNIFGSQDSEYYIKKCKSNSLADCQRVTEECFRENPDITGIVAWSDLIAAGALQYLNKENTGSASNIEVIGYDDILAPFLSPPISSVHMPLKEMSMAAIQIIAESESNPLSEYARTILVEPKLVIRQNNES